jgi:guanylate kinase
LNRLYVFTGYSGSGKCAVANILNTVGGYNVVRSYTTKPRKDDIDESHIFVSDVNYDDIPNKLAETIIGDYRYCTTNEQLESSDIFVMDGKGLEDIVDALGRSRHIIVIYFGANIRTRIDNMRKRGDCDTTILNKIYKDEESDLENCVHKIVWNYCHNEECDIEMITINANRDMDIVVKEVSDIMRDASENKNN